MILAFGVGLVIETVLGMVSWLVAALLRGGAHAICDGGGGCGVFGLHGREQLCVLAGTGCAERPALSASENSRIYDCAGRNSGEIA